MSADNPLERPEIRAALASLQAGADEALRGMSEPGALAWVDEFAQGFLDASAGGESPCRVVPGESFFNSVTGVLDIVISFLAPAPTEYVTVAFDHPIPRSTPE